MNALAGWTNFYVIVGSSAGALIGLQFVVMTLISDLPGGRSAAQAGHAFSTPTIVHFGTVLLLAAGLNAPWQGISGPAIFCGLIGLNGVVYAVTVARRMRLQTLYKPEFEDWLFHAILPFVAYATLAVSAYSARSHEREAWFATAVAALLLLFSGIHNAWDAVTYHVFHKKPRQQEHD
jgi:hypothetical protein